ncbi:hypothetical protein BDV26DRAFT_258861 [Aspergillus bertholletiae]|uniref:Uncharacterized protein n=1 Tax=Aspergillus bertholletiae TaxID=1226010 RepID=A0A5N7BCY1_9EURO|nr:hypothetical protein BDV26DRAFT_258861 [Aspergillus bertholletiae]
MEAGGGPPETQSTPPPYQPQRIGPTRITYPIYNSIPGIPYFLLLLLLSVFCFPTGKYVGMTWAHSTSNLQLALPLRRLFVAGVMNASLCNRHCLL